MSVVIPTFNREQYLALAVASVQAQTLGSWELFVVDDGSVDGSRSVADAFAASDKRVHVIGQPKRGIAAARNRGIRHMTRETQFVAFLDDDDLWEPTALEVLTGALDRSPRAVAAHGLARRIDAEGREVQDPSFDKRQLTRRGIQRGRVAVWPSDKPTTFAVFAYANAIPTPGQVVIRRLALDRAGVFHDPAADWRMWLRLAAEGDFVFVPDVVVRYRVHSGNFSRPHLRNAKTKIRVHWSLLWWPNLTSRQRFVAWMAFAHYYRDFPRFVRTVKRTASSIRRVRAPHR